MAVFGEWSTSQLGLVIGGEEYVSYGEDLVGPGVVRVGLSSFESEFAAKREISVAEIVG